ncbi:uncharacterized protein PHALS_00619 [Plasmopara halstedii]|uniref:RxLR-like protein n=1 Tax=Plasmopara halstedii TaxID=4781 RepID=A0A0N7L8P8_PLAHL|nr:uncharacterized protein PHALS_00619 [Plasmopara halstedii]CEG50475.1 hypothetical protein PHALS_00619 [Plasmopara halstedii]|eukprot:XP_024586844.1 hypothetical protein PHALS_00619 [Plasmopara halstedii]
MTLAHGGQLQSFIWLFIVVLESVCFASDGSNLDVGTVAAASATGSATEGDIGNGEDDEQLQRQLTTLRVCGWLVLLLYVALSLAIVWQTSLHFLYSSASAKKAFHVTLLVSMLLQLSQAIEWIWFPTSHAWKVIYVCRLHSLLLLSFCKSYLAVCWAGVVSAGQQLARRRMTKYVTGMNALLILWGVIVPILLAGYSDNINGQYSFMNSTFRSVLKFSDGFIVLAYGVLLGYQGFCLRRRLQLARGTVPADSVEKSLSQLMLAISIFIVSDLMRILAMVLNESQVAMSILIYLIMYNIIPNIFPTLCMLHLMRRLTRKDGSNSPTRTAALEAMGLIVKMLWLERN